MSVFKLYLALLDVLLYETQIVTSDNIDAFEAVKPSMFADIKVIAVGRSWLFALDIRPT